DLAVNVNDLGIGVGTQSRERVMEDRCRPGRVEGWRFNLVHRSGLFEVLVDAGGDEGVVAVYGLLKHRARNRLPLIGIADTAGEFANRIRAEEEAVRIDIRRLWVPLLSCHRIGVENCPDRTAAVEL